MSTVTTYCKYESTNQHAQIGRTERIYITDEIVETLYQLWTAYSRLIKRELSDRFSVKDECNKEFLTNYGI